MILTLHPVYFYVQDYEKQKKPGTSYQLVYHLVTS